MTSHALVSTPLSGQISPIERLGLPAHLDGREGTNRGPRRRAQIKADNDLDAIKAWLAEFADSPNTLRSYRKEAERLLLWSLFDRHCPLSSLRREDLITYEAFLADPRPRTRWCGKRTPRQSPDWRPFEGPLRAESRRQTMIVLNALFSYLVQAGYLAGNPLALVRRRKRRGRRSAWHGNERNIDHESWTFTLKALDELPEGTDRERAEKERLRFLLAALYLLGPRVSELATHTMGSLYRRNGRWWWRVVGKGEREAKVPANDDFVAALKRYRKFLGLTSTPSPADPTPMILNITGTRGISANMIYRLIKKFFAHVAVEAEHRLPDSVDLFNRVSTHWLRHTSITHQADAGIELRYLSRNARHARLETTGIYLHAEDKKWHSAMNKLHLRVKLGAS